MTRFIDNQRGTEFVESGIAKDARVLADGNGAYNGLDGHETLNHGDGERVRGEVRINGTESLWAPESAAAAAP